MKNKIKLLMIILIILGILFRVALINSDFSGEETDFVKPAEAIANNSHPVFYHSEQQPVEVALWHPPTYIFLMGFIFKFWQGEIPARSINIIFSILTAILIYFFCSKLIQNKNSKIIGLISSAIFLTNYYTLSSSIIIDIDVLSMFFVFGFFFFITLYSYKQKIYLLILSFVFFFFGIANRYPMMILSYLAVLIYYYFNPELKKQIKSYFLVGISGGIAFLIIWAVYSLIIEPGNFFSFISHNVQLGEEQFSNLKVYLLSFGLNIAQIIRLFTLPLVILFIWGLKSFFSKKESYIKILLFYSWSIFLFFLLLPRPAFGYPRYFLTALPGICILIGIFIWENLEQIKINEKYTLVFLIGLVLSINTLFLLNPQLTSYESNGLIKATNIPDFLFNLLGIFPIFLGFLFKADRKKIKFILLLSLLLSYSIYFDIKLVTYESNIKDVANYLKENTNSEDIIISPKAIGYYSDRRFYINEDTKPPLNLTADYLKRYFLESLKNREMDNEFFWPTGIYSGLYKPHPNEEELKKIVSYVVLYHPLSEIKYEKKIGQFHVYNLKHNII